MCVECFYIDEESWNFDLPHGEWDPEIEVPELNPDGSLADPEDLG